VHIHPRWLQLSSGTDDTAFVACLGVVLVDAQQHTDALVARIQAENLTSRMRGVDALVVRLNSLFDQDVIHRQELDTAAAKIQVGKPRARALCHACP
jgi:hypothetical protein